MIKLTDILKTLLKEQGEEQQTPKNPEFEENPMGYILKKYKRLSENLVELMGEEFEEYLSGVFIVSGKPTTFKVLLKNGQYFFMTFMGKAYEASVLGKRYYLMNIGEIQQATMEISRILRYGSKQDAKGPEGESGPRSQESSTDEEPGLAEPEEVPAEA
jgi:hypothetical protein